MLAFSAITLWVKRVAPWTFTWKGRKGWKDDVPHGSLPSAFKDIVWRVWLVAQDQKSAETSKNKSNLRLSLKSNSTYVYIYIYVYAYIIIRLFKACTALGMTPGFQHVWLFPGYVSDMFCSPSIEIATGEVHNAQNWRSAGSARWDPPDWLCRDRVSYRVMLSCQAADGDPSGNAHCATTLTIIKTSTFLLIWGNFYPNDQFLLQ